jgi:hypothetical protein
MPSSKNNPLPLIGGLVGILALGGASLRWLNAPTATTGTEPPSAVANHVENQLHASNIQSFGNCHIEAQTTRSGGLTLIVSGIKDKDLLPIETDPPLELQALTQGEDPVPVTMAPKPYPGEPRGTSSRFVGQIPNFQPGQTGLTLTLAFQGHNYRIQWPGLALMPGAGAASEDAAMPEALGSAEAQKLFLTPGGLYTQADIDANGKTTATAKYGSTMASHNAHPKPGDSLCPISETVANPKFTWVIGGEKYTFCCPPCIEEFVRKAKENPDAIKPPGAYVKS